MRALPHKISNALGYMVTNYISEGAPSLIVSKSFHGDEFMNLIVDGHLVVVNLREFVNAMTLVRKDQLKQNGIIVVTPDVSVQL